MLDKREAWVLEEVVSVVEGTRPSADPLPFTLLLLEALTDAYNPVSDYRTRLVSAKECMQEMRHDLDHALAQTSKVEEHEGKKARRSLDPNASWSADMYFCKAGFVLLRKCVNITA